MSPNLIEELWEQFEFKPNDAQREAILHADGPLYLPAGPGSGKTRVLLWRTVNLIVQHRVSPESIFLATFTEKAARQLQEGMRLFLGAVTNRTGVSYDVDRMYVGTVHSLCQRLISDRRLYKDRHAVRPPTVLDELDQYFHLYRKSRWTAFMDGLELGEEPCAPINVLFGKNSVSRHEAAVNCLNLFNRISEECLTQSDWHEKSLDPTFAALLACYMRYRDSLTQKPVRTDFSLLQQDAYEVVAAHTGAPIFQHVIVDEYQDTNTIQERLFFRLADQSRNLCAVGDDDQALYRFRGATVENFVQFPARCEAHWNLKPRGIPLATNYRSRKAIVDFYVRFMEWCDWSDTGSKGGRQQPYNGDYYRVAGKGIHAHSADDGPAVVATTRTTPELGCAELATFCKRLLDEGIVENASQIAFLYPSLKSVQVGRMREALEHVGLSVYAPRAGTFLEVPEAEAVFGIMLRVFGKPAKDFEPATGSDFYRYHVWMDGAGHMADSLIKSDAALGGFVKDKKAEIARILKDAKILAAVAEAKKWDLKAPYDLRTMRRSLATASSLSLEAQKTLTSAYFDRVVENRARDGEPFTLNYIINRATSLDWNLLDLFYRLCGFGHFKTMFDLAEDGQDEGPICNLGLVSQYIARFSEEYTSILTAGALEDDKLQHMLFSSYLYVLFRRGESEYEDAEDPFPRGRIPFLTIHQSKGLEFPVVVLGNTAQRDMPPQPVEQLVAPLLSRKGEPLTRISEFDAMRKFYVGLSRAQNLLILAHFRGAGSTPYEPFRILLDDSLPRIPDFDLADVPHAKLGADGIPRNYSYTSDYLAYETCPRRYMIFRKYGFVPSRSQTMMFGSLVHRTLDDLHQLLIARRSQP